MPHATTAARISQLAIAIAVALTLQAAPAVGAVAFVKKIETVAVASSSTASTGSFSSAVTSGNLIVVRIWYNDATRSVSSVSDTKGNTYARAAGPTTGPSSLAGWRQELWYAKNVTGGTTFSVTATFDATFSTEKSIAAFEYSGADAASPLDRTAATTTTGANAASPSVATTSASELLFGAALFGSCGNAGSGFTARSTLNCNVAEDKTVSTTGSYSATFSNTSQAAVVQLATFRASGQAVDTTPPSTPTGLSASAASNSQINLSWTASTDNIGVTGYRVYRNSAQVGSPIGTTYSDTGLVAATTYTYTVAAVDAAGNVSSQSTSASATTSSGADTTPPTVPSNLVATAASASAINLTWTASTDNVAVATYSVYRGSVFVASVSTPGYTDGGLAASTTYTYNVAAIDSSGNASALSTAASAKTLAATDTVPPSVPTGLSATAISATDVALAWTASTDNVGVAGYQVFRGGTPIRTVTGTAFVDSGLVASTSYSYSVAAFDAAGNTSAQSSAASATTQAPAAVSYTTAFPLTENPISEGGRWITGRAVGLDWSDVATNAGFAYGLESGVTGYDDATAVLTGTWGTDQTAEATVYSVHQNDSIFEEVELRLRTTIAPHSITGYEINFSARSDSNGYVQIVRWNGPLSSWTLLDSRDGAAYGIRTGDVIRATIVGNQITAYLNGVQVLQVTDSVYSAGSPGIGFYLQNTTGVNMDYGFTNFTATSNAPIDTQAPTVPGGLQATPTSQSEIDLTWLPSADNVGTVGYRVFRNGSAVATVSGTSFANVGLMASTTYTFAVAAMDAAGNTSALSPITTATTLAPPPDTTPPTAPGGVTATAQNSSTIVVNWTASTDNVGVAGYRVYRSGVAIASVTSGTSFTDLGVNASTVYTYQVAAYDAANNLSTISPSASVTTPGTGFSTGVVYAATCSSTDVQAAVDAASDGFTVVLPAGSCAWTAVAGAAAVAISQKSITLQGAGADQTILSATVSTGLATALRIDAGSGRPVRLTGVTLSTTSASIELLTVAGASQTVRIDHNKFDAPTAVTAVHVAGALYGVIDHNTFHNASAIVEDDGDGSWQRPLNLGGGDALYFEDNTFQFDAPARAVGGSAGARYVFRHNTLNAGVQDFSNCETGARGVRKVEIYNNTFAADTWSPSAPVVLLGGTGVVFGNTVSGPFSASAIVVSDARSDATACAGLWAPQPACDGSSPFDGNTPDLSGYLCRDQIGASTDAGLSTAQSSDPLFAWNNVGPTGSVDIVAGGGAGSLAHVAANRDFFNSARPDYVDYVYPHPLVSGPALDLVPPSVAITSPSAGAAVTGVVTIVASAIDNVGVASVTIAVDGASLGPPLVGPPYSAAWNAAASIPGAHTLTATAVDAAGNTAVSTGVVVYAQDTTPPVISALAETGTTDAGTTITWTTDEAASSQVVFSVGPCPYTTQCVGAIVPALVTTHSVVVGGLVPSTAYTYSVNSTDASGNTATSPPRTFTTAADATPPIVAIASPTGGTVSGSLTVAASASDDVAVVNVQVMLDGNPIGQATAPPWSITWNSALTSNGAHVLTASARDGAGNVATSNPVTITVSNDVTAPTIALTSPTNNASVVGTVTLTATASDNVGVKGVKFAVDGTTIGAEVTSPPYTTSWNTTGASNGSHAISATARDAAGNTSTATVTVTVANPVTYYPASYSVSTGTFQSGTTSSLTADDNNYLVVKSSTSGSSRQSVTAFTFSKVAPGSRIAPTVRLKSSVSNTSIVVSAMNYTSGTWTQLTTGTVGISESTITAAITTGAANYVNASGQMSLRVQSSSGSTHSVSFEIVSAVVTP